MSEKEKKTTTKKKTTKKVANDTKKAYCYIGPNIPGGSLKQNAVIVGTRAEIADKYQEEIEKYPQIERLTIPVERLAQAKARVVVTGNVLNKYYQDLISSIHAEREV